MGAPDADDVQRRGVQFCWRSARLRLSGDARSARHGDRASANLGFDLYAHGFNLLTFWGLTVTYLYFQIPLMVLVVAPAIDGLRREWAEAAETLGASAFQYWRLIALPILWPSALGATLLLFANAFGAIATA